MPSPKPSQRSALTLAAAAALLVLLAVMGAPTASAQTCASPVVPDFNQELLNLLGGNVIKPKAPVNITVWKGDAALPHFVFPELSDGDYGIPALQAKPNFGIGVSGGGLRAACLGLGYIRGMLDAGLFNKARYLGSASGGTFASAMVTFSNPAKLAGLMGPYRAPQYCTVKNMTDFGKGVSIGSARGVTFLGALTDATPSFYQTFLESLGQATSASTRNSESESAYSRSISVFVMNRLGLGLWNSTITVSGTRGDISKRIKRIGANYHFKVYEADGNAPFPLMTGNILDSHDAVYFFPFEMTPLYSGSPCNFSAYTATKKGGGLIEPLGFNSDALLYPEHMPIGEPSWVVVNSTYIQPLVGRLAVSGGIMAVELGNLIQAQPVEPGTPISSSSAGQPYYDIFSFKNFETLRYPYGDGGYSDNEGLVAMLRRKVTKILLFYAIADPINDKAIWSMRNSGLSQPFGRCVNCYTSLNASLTDDIVNNASRVFQQSEEFDRLFDEYQANHCKGSVNVWNATLDVIDNPFMGVQGGWKVELMIVMNAQITEWEDQLPEDTKLILNRSRTDKVWLARAQQHNLQTYKLVTFPFFDIQIFQYDRLSAGALMNMATWTVRQLEQRIRDFIGN